MSKQINIALLGFGTVGSGTARILLQEMDLLEKRAGCPIRLKWICDQDLETDRGFPVPEEILTDNLSEVMDDPEVHILIELIGGIEPARTFVLDAINRGKHVVTANKALLALHGKEIFRTADNKGVEVGFEASVAGGIPVIKAVREGLVANNIQTVLGILNGTANYILTRMTEEGMPFEQVLAEAQDKGYAEADPTYDIEGIDTAHKLAIMSTLAYGGQVDLEDIYTEGISSISPLDISFAAEFGYNIKLLAIARNSERGLDLRIHPTMVPSDHLLAQVGGAYNACYLVGDSVGKVMLYGMGAGQMPTGSAVVADVVDIARNISRNSVGRVPSLGVPVDCLETPAFMPMDDLSGCYYFRFSVKDQPGVLARIAGVLGDNNISINSCVQKGRGSQAGPVPIVMVTHEAREADVRRALENIDNMDVVMDRTMIIRIEELDAL